jgi:hypothetical protein
MLSSCGWDLASGIISAVYLGVAWDLDYGASLMWSVFIGILMYCCLKNRKIPGCRWSPLEADPIVGFPPPAEREVRLSFRIKLLKT